MKRLLSLAIIIFSCAFVSMAQQVPASTLKITSIDVRQNGEMIDIEFSAQLESSATESKRMLIITPVVSSENDKSFVELPQIIIRGEFAQKKYECKGDDRAVGYAVKRPAAINAVNGSQIDYNVSIPYGNWMKDGCSIKFNGILYGKAYAAETFIGVITPDMKIVEKIELIYPNK